MDKKKKIIIATVIIMVLLVLAIVIFNLVRKNNKTEITKTAELSELIDVENIEDIPYGIEKTEEEISSKYTTNRKYEVKAKVQASDITGKMIYVRNSYEKLNIFKAEYELSKYGDKAREISDIIQEFEMICEGYMEITEDEYEESDQLYGESSVDFELPVEESIYTEGRLYSKTYKNGESEYDINFYKKDEKIICEFVKVLKYQMQKNK